MKKEFYSNGKLLLSGEYAILDGALGLAIPTSYGQSLHVTPTTTGFLEWTSFEENKNIWFSAKLDLTNLSIVSTSDQSVAKTLKSLLLEANEQNPLLLTDSEGFQIETHLTFPTSWGLGTSSTLINNLAQWARVDAYQLLWNAFGGSGYDIACAQHVSAITYQLKDGKPEINKVSFDPKFKDSLYFIHLNQKQSSKEAIANYRKQQFNKDDLLGRISDITNNMVSENILTKFESLMEEHEAILSEILQIPTVKSRIFPDYPNAIKSLGAWGGDFVLAVGNENTLDYFRGKGFKTIIPFSKMAL
ncbi:GHMP kinase [Flagellimonas alvinocaridis]|uniref:GHMP kinase n=1 Tax=Flagellimonas alvinocaridis TaxID=2530200 RepID=A0A4S8S1Q6_9FLAO|nr:GYDIA family GHMP kinase [Allomuricauda alvinocaridis]THV61684.1 GHMP kinase [Allomuricauda alvinocaridis]